MLHLALGMALWFGFMAGGHGAITDGGGEGTVFPPVEELPDAGEVLGDVGEGLKRLFF